MKMSHMLADSHTELVEMADKIGVDRKWIQHEGKGRHREHFDIAMSKRKLAIEQGAIEVEYGKGLKDLITRLMIVQDG